MSTQNQYLSALDFGVTITLINRRCFNAKIWLPFQWLFFQASCDYLTYLQLSYWYGYLFKHHDLSTRVNSNQHHLNRQSDWWINVDKWILNQSGCHVDQRCNIISIHSIFNIFQHWINVECLPYNSFYNQFHNFLRNFLPIFLVSTNFLFTASETIGDYYL